MEQVHQYIKRLLVFGLCLLVYFYSVPFIPVYIVVPVLVLAFSLLHARISGEKPPHLFAFYRTDSFFKKGGLRDLIRIFVTLFGFLYDSVIWTVWGVYLVFMLFIDLLDLLKNIFFWILHALLWFLRQYVPFIILLYKLFIHYMIRWPWWLYQIAYFNIPYAFNKNAYRIALSGTLLATLIVFVFYYLELFLVKIPGITFIGIVISLLPLAWSFGEIAALRVNKMEDERFSTVRLKFQNGIEAVRSILFYVTLFVVLLLAQIGLNLLGWIPNSGISLGSFVFTLNTLLSLLLLFISLVIVLGVVVLPSYRLYKPFSEVRLSDSIHLLKMILQKFLQYLIISIPNTLFTVFIIVLPLAVVMLAAIASYNIKNFTVNLRIENLKTQQANNNQPIEAYVLGKKIEHLKSLKDFPQDVFQELQHREILSTELSLAEEDLKSDSEEALRTIEDTQESIGKLQQEVRDRMSDPADPMLESLKNQVAVAQNELKAYETQKEIELAKMKADIDLLRQRKKQVPYLFLFGGLWLVIFGSLVIAFITSYLGNIYHQVYIFRNDDTSSEWMNIVREIRAGNSRQPLLGGTLFVITAAILYLWITGSAYLSALAAILLNLLTP